MRRDRRAKRLLDRKPDVMVAGEPDPRSRLGLLEVINR